MIQKSLTLKTLRNSMLLLFFSISFSTFAQTIDVDLTSSTHVIKKTVSTSNGVKTFELTIPFYRSHISQVSLKTTDYACSGNLEIVVNGFPSNYQNPNDFNKYRIQGLQVGTTTYDVKSLCNGMIKLMEQVKIVVVREPTPVLDLSFTGECSKKNGKYTGYVYLFATGSYTNAGKLFLRTTPNNNNCPEEIQKLANLGSYNLPNNTIVKTGFYQCNKSGTYNVTLEYRSYDVNGVVIIHEIPNNQFGWKNYSFTKTFKTCMDVDHVVLQPRFKGNSNSNTLSLSNPVKDDLKLFLNSDDNANYEIEIYDFTGLSVKKASLKDVNSNSTNTINVQDLKKGIYIVEIKNGDSVIREKMIKE